LQGEGVSIQINKFIFELASGSYSEEQMDDCDYKDLENVDFSKYVQKPQKTMPFGIEGEKYCAAVNCLSIFARCYWYLTPEDAGDFTDDEEESHILTYQQLEKGKFRWECACPGWFVTSLVMIPSYELWDSVTFAEKSAVFFYNVDNISEDKGLEQIYLCCNYWVKDGVTARNKKYILGQ
jgi:hypothetical protein